MRSGRSFASFIRFSEWKRSFVFIRLHSLLDVFQSIPPVFECSELTEEPISRRVLKDPLHYSDFFAAIRNFSRFQEAQRDGVFIFFSCPTCQRAEHIYEEITMRYFCGKQAANTCAAQAWIVVLVISSQPSFGFCIHALTTNSNH